MAEVKSKSSKEDAHPDKSLPGSFLGSAFPVHILQHPITCTLLAYGCHGCHLTWQCTCCQNSTLSWTVDLVFTESVTYPTATNLNSSWFLAGFLASIALMKQCTKSCQQLVGVKQHHKSPPQPSMGKGQCETCFVERGRNDQETAEARGKCTKSKLTNVQTARVHSRQNTSLMLQFPAISVLSCQVLKVTEHFCSRNLSGHVGAATRLRTMSSTMVPSVAPFQHSQ